MRHGFGHQIFTAKAAETGDASECSEQRLTFLTLVPEKIRGHPCNPHGLSSFSREHDFFWYSNFQKNATDHQLKVTTVSLGTFGNFRGLQLLHHWSEQIAKIAQRILMIMTMSITTVQRIVAIAIVFTTVITCCHHGCH